MRKKTKLPASQSDDYRPTRALALRFVYTNHFLLLGKMGLWELSKDDM